MPVYEYRCDSCGENFEVEQKMTDDPLTTHEKCGGKLSKVFSSVGIVWKGQGFYKTDTRGSSSTSKPASPSKKSESSSESTKTSTSTSSESKPSKPST